MATLTNAHAFNGTIGRSNTLDIAGVPVPASLEKQFINGGQIIIKKQLNDFAKAVKNTNINNLSELPIRYKGELTKLLTDLYSKAFSEGNRQVNDELNQNIEVKENKDLIKAQASIIANNIAERIKTKFLFEYMKEVNNTNDIEKASNKAFKMILGV